MASGGVNPVQYQQQQAQEENEQTKYKDFIDGINVPIGNNIRPKKMNIKEFIKTIEEIYTFKFDHKSLGDSNINQLSKAQI